MPKTKSACSERTFPPASRQVMANRKLGCLTLFLFLALCASVIINVFLAIAVLGRVGTGVVREEPLTKFREIVVQRGGRGISDRVAVIVMRGLISSSVPGAAAVIFQSGKFKDLLNGARPMTPEEREFVQNFVMKTYDKFLGIVAKERNLPADGLRNSIADGRIFSGREALENKLIDGVGQIEDAYAKAKQLGGAPEATVVKYAAPFSLFRFFRALGETNQSKLQIELPKQLLPQLESGRAYFLPSYYAP